uniref:tetra-peptide repeat homeobox protein 1 n=1 Tax=Macaca mulatta TaxID=9544 RepID=UPI0010A25E85|nr:tetra-peptide repeat homeobox protein 1 [Macaca mulatta]
MLPAFPSAAIRGAAPAHSPSLAPDPPRRQRQERTVYTQSQQEVLESYFQNDQYPNYHKRQKLAEELGLKEHQLQDRPKLCPTRSPGAQTSGPPENPRSLPSNPPWPPGLPGRGLRPAPPPSGSPDRARPSLTPPPCPLCPQVWFKNRRAKLARERRLQQQPQRVPGRRGRGARAEPLVPAAAASAPQPGLSGILPAAEPTICSLDQAWGGPGCRAQKGIPDVLGPGPGPIPAPIRGPAQVPGPISGPISGRVQIPGPLLGPIPGPAQIPGPLAGPLPGPISGPAQIPGPLPGPLPGPISGPAQIPGPLAGPLPGPISGPAQIPGPLLGPIPGPISGPAQVPDQAQIPGPISGPGPITGEIPGLAQIPGPGRLGGPGPILSPGQMPSSGSLPGPAPILGPGPGSVPAPIPGPGSFLAPAPVPLWPESPDASDFLPDTQLFPQFTELLPPLDPLEGSSVSTMTSQYQEGDDSMGQKDSGSLYQEECGSVNENDSGPRSLLDL